MIIESIVKQLGQIHRCRGNPCYRYVNPFSIVVSEEKELSFLDLNSKENAPILRMIQRRSIRELFLPPDQPYYQIESIALDLYGLGKTIQYILSEVDAQPCLTKKEELKFQKLISKCLKEHSKKSFQNISEVQRSIPKYKPVDRKTKMNKKMAGVIVLALILGIAIGKVETKTTQSIKEKDRVSSTQIAEKKIQNKKIEEVNKSLKETEKEKEELAMQLGRLYFLELSDYQKSREYFGEAEDNPLAAWMEIVAECMVDTQKNRELFETLEQAEAELEKQKELEEEEQIEYYQCLLAGYGILDEERAEEQIIRIGEICLKKVEEEKKGKILSYVAGAYEKQENYLEAARLYEEQLLYEQDEKKKEELYQIIATDYELVDQPQQAQEIYLEGMKECTQSARLRIGYLRLHFSDPLIERTVCMQRVNEQLTEYPELSKEEEFQKLMKENGLEVKGGKVWEKGKQ